MREVIIKPEEIGLRIKLARKRKGLAQNEFAEMIGKSVRTVQKYETGDISMPLEVFGDIANILDTTPAELLYEEKPGVHIDTYADVICAIFAMEDSKTIQIEVEEVSTPDNTRHLALYCDAANYEFERNRFFNDFLKEFKFYREAHKNGTLPDEIYEAWRDKTLIAADEMSIRY